MYAFFRSLPLSTIEETLSTAFRCFHLFKFTDVVFVEIIDLLMRVTSIPKNKNKRKADVDKKKNFKKLIQYSEKNYFIFLGMKERLAWHFINLKMSWNRVKIVR